MKDSLLKAMGQARTMSLEHPDITYFVFDAPRKKSRVYSEFTINVPLFSYEIMKEGFSPRYKFVNGEMECSLV